MPRRPDVPCAGCGKLMWRGKNSLPAGVATCHACRHERRKVECPTLDHLVPIVAGGEHSYANVRAAHRRCNSRRGALGVAQLALFG